MIEHSTEIIQLLIWFLILIGGAFMSVLLWIGKVIKDAIASELSEIKAEIQLTNNTLKNIEKDLRGDLANLDRRVTKLETRCDAEHRFGEKR